MKTSNDVDRCIKCNSIGLEFKDNSIDRIINPNKGYAEKISVVRCSICGTYHYFIIDHEDKMFLELIEDDEIKEHRLDLWKWGK